VIPTTSHQDAQHKAVDDRCSRNGNLAKCLFQTAAAMNSGYFQTGFIDVVVQKPRPYDIYDAFVFLNCKTCLENGWIAYRLVELGDEPGPDRATEENNRALQQLPPDLTARFHGGLGDADGYVRLSAAAEFTVTVGDTDQPYRVAPRTFPLEVGTTLGSRTWFHLFRERALARWPYGQTVLHLWTVTKAGHRRVGIGL